MSRSGGARTIVLAVLVLLVALVAIGVGMLLPRPPAPPAPSLGSSASPGTQGPRPSAAYELFVGAGDIADCGSEGDEQTAAILDELPAAQVFTLGDNAYENGTRAEFEECYAPSWGRHRDRTWPSPGNHEYGTSGAAGYFDYFGDRAGSPDQGWYAFDLGGWRIYSLNSNCSYVGGCGRDSRQIAWLGDDLAEHPRRCALALMHHPRFSSGEHGNTGSLGVLWRTLHAAGVELVLAGHDHSYERFEPMDASGEPDAERGMVQFVVGTGGRRHYGFDVIRPTSVARSSGVWGVLELALGPEGWSSRFLPVAGASYSDRASGTCH